MLDDTRQRRRQAARAPRVLNKRKGCVPPGAVYIGRRVRHPQWIVALVRSDLIWSGDGDFSELRRRPLTRREQKRGEERQ
jgi:hypothetical protein